MYIHEKLEWPRLHWSSETLATVLADVRHRQGRLLGQMEALGFGLREEAVLRTLTEDVVKSSEIEGEKLDADAVRSSIARRLGMHVGGLKTADRNVEGVVEMMLDATRNYDKPLTDERLFGWHASLFPTRRAGCGAYVSECGVTTGMARCRWYPSRSGGTGYTSRRRPPREFGGRWQVFSTGSTAEKRLIRC